MPRKRKLPASGAEAVPDEVFAEFGKGKGLEKVTYLDGGWNRASKASAKQAEQLERDLILNRIILAIVEAHPRKERKRGNEPNLNRVRQVRTALLGEAPRPGRPRQVKEEILDCIALQFFIFYFKNGKEPRLDRILKDTLVPNRTKLELDDKQIENRIKRYRKAFKENKDWLLLRNSQMLDVPHTPSSTEENTIKYLLDLAGHSTPK